jgi:hypothetical protein
VPLKLIKSFVLLQKHCKPPNEISRNFQGNNLYNLRNLEKFWCQKWEILILKMEALVFITLRWCFLNISNILHWFHQLTSLKSRIALQVARKIAPCNMAFSASPFLMFINILCSSVLLYIIILLSFFLVILLLCLHFCYYIVHV